MPIAALPASTVRLLGSSVTITTPCDLVKELVDNAIDAKATSIEVAISANALEKITVRDDGHGIQADDFDSLGRRSYTSKLQAFHELKTRECETLGFRGEALFGACSLARITLTTRTAQDPVASRLQLRLGVGGVEERRPVSAPVGTTVQATKLFENLPARKQYSLKNSAKFISAIKELLKAYALARPDLRLAFKMPGNATHTWLYAPNHSSTVHEAVLQIFGKELATACIQVSHTQEHDHPMQPPGDKRLPVEFILDAFVPKSKKLNVQAINAKGIYLSVNFRPVSAARGIFRRIVGIFKSHLTRTMDSTTPLISPFMQLNIRCPPCSYDPNVTPLKDEILFADDEKLLSCFEALCRKVYRQAHIVSGTNNAPPLQRPDVIARMKLRHAGRQLAPAEPLSNDEERDNFSCSHLPHNPEMLDKLDRLPVASLLANPDEVTSRQPQEYTGEVQTRSAKMRTVKAVNMSRTESNTTDETSIMDSVVVQVPVLSMLEGSSKPAAKIRLKPTAKGHILENIERYFRPEQGENFCIASDETATTTEHPSTLRSTQEKGSSGRLPLQPLSESTLNEIQGQAEQGSDDSSVSFGILQPRSASRGDLGAPPLVREWFGTTGSHGQERTPPDSSPPSHMRRQAIFRSPGEQADALGLQTPPSSNPSRRERWALNPPLRPPQTSNIPAGYLTQARRNSRASNGSGVYAGLLRRARVSSRSTANRSTVRQGEARLDINHNSVAWGGQPDIIPRVAHSGNHSPSRHETGGLHQQARSSSSDPSNVFHCSPHGQTPRHEFTAGPFAQQHNSQYSGPTQRLLMRSPPPVVPSADKSESEHNMTAADGDAQAILGNGPPVSNILPWGQSHATAYHDGIASEDGEDPRRYLIHKRRSQARYGRPRRLSSRRLPLEVIPDAMKLHNTWTRLELSPGDVMLNMERFALLERNITTGNSESPLSFRDMEEAGAVETRLRRMVDLWLEEGNRELTIEYTLRSAAKGKRQV